MKKRILMLSILVICIAILATGTLAYYNAAGTAHNVITTGNVKIAVQEWANEAKTEPFEDLDGMLPGRTATKIVEIKNTGSADAWVRVSIAKAIKLENNEYDPKTELIELDLNTTDWEVGNDGYLYYKEILKSGEVTAPVFTEVKFNESMGNTYKNSTITIDIAAQAVQSAHNGSTVADAQGWPAA